VLVRNDVAVNFDWGLGSPDPSIPADNFSARWTRRLPFQAGTYRFCAGVDDGVRLYVAGALLINKWVIQSPTTYAADIYLGDGDHDIRMEYYDETLGALAILSWQRVDTYADWQAQYFNNPDLAGSPVLVRNDSSINFNWGYGSPGSGVPVDNFSARWTRLVNFDSGTYTFHSRSDDGMRVWVDNDLVIDNWRDGDCGDINVQRNITAGTRQLRVEYYERSGTAFASFSWSRSDYPMQPPLAVIKAPTEAQVKKSVSFDGRVSHSYNGRIIRWDWDFVDGNSASGDKVSHTYNNTGNYTVKLKVTDEYGLSDRTDMRITIKDDIGDNTPPVAVINTNSTGAVNLMHRFDGSKSYSISPIDYYEWYFGDGQSASGPVQDKAYTKAGFYNVTLTVVARNGLRNSQTVTVRIDDPITPSDYPLARITAPGTAQMGQPVTFDASTSEPGLNATMTNYRWSFGDGATADAVNIQHTYNNAGTYNVTLEVVNSKGLSNSTSQQLQIVVVPPPQPVIDVVVVSPDPHYVGTAVQFQVSAVSASPITQYQWDFGDGNTHTSTDPNLSYIYSGPGQFTVNVTATDSQGQSGSNSANVTILDTPSAPQPVISGPGTGTVNQSITFTGSDSRDPANTTPSLTSFGMSHRWWPHPIKRRPAIQPDHLL
jgi:PKD repeat protein